MEIFPLSKGSLRVDYYKDYLWAQFYNFHNRGNEFKALTLHDEDNNTYTFFEETLDFLLQIARHTKEEIDLKLKNGDLFLEEEEYVVFKKLLQKAVNTHVQIGAIYGCVIIRKKEVFIVLQQLNPYTLESDKLNEVVFTLEDDFEAMKSYVRSKY